MIKYKGCNYCRHYRFDGTCPAFDPDAIPLDIVSGATKHIIPLAEQSNTIVYEPAEKSMIERLKERRQSILNDAESGASAGCRKQ